MKNEFVPLNDLLEVEFQYVGGDMTRAVLLPSSRRGDEKELTRFNGSDIAQAQLDFTEAGALFYIHALSRRDSWPTDMIASFKRASLHWIDTVTVGYVGSPYSLFKDTVRIARPDIDFFNADPSFSRAFRNGLMTAHECFMGASVGIGIGKGVFKGEGFSQFSDPAPLTDIMRRLINADFSRKSQLFPQILAETLRALGTRREERGLGVNVPEGDLTKFREDLIRDFEGVWHSLFNQSLDFEIVQGGCFER